MKSLSSKIRNILIVLIAINVVAISGYGFLLSRVIAESKTVSSFLEELSLEVDKETRLRSLAQLIQDVTDDEVLLAEQFLSSDENSVAAYITEIESLANIVPVTIRIVSVDTQGTVEDGTGVLRVRTTASGSKKEIKDFITLIELLPKITAIDVADISVSQQVAEESIIEEWNASLTLRTLLLN